MTDGTAEAISLRPMTEGEFDAWREAAIHAYASEQVEAGACPPEDARTRAEAAHAALLPGGFGTPGMLFLKGVRAGGAPVGLVWAGLKHPRGVPDCAFLYEIEVEETLRGRGWGRALLAAAESLVRESGIAGLELNVLAGNAAAIGLYNGSGYAVVSQRMRKSL